MELIKKCAEELGHDVSLLLWQQAFKVWPGLIYEEPLHWAAVSRFTFINARRKILYTTIEGTLLNPYTTPEISRSYRFVANSEFTRMCLVESGVKCEDICGHAIDYDRLTELREKEIKYSAPIHFCYVGDSQPRKGMPRLLEALEILHQEAPNEWKLFLNIWGG